LDRLLIWLVLLDCAASERELAPADQSARGSSQARGARLYGCRRAATAIEIDIAASAPAISVMLTIGELP
jgi:hypothetical protein